MRLRLLTSTSLFFGFAFAAASPAQAQNTVAADAAFREGRKLLKAERYEEACEKFALSQKLEPAIGTLGNLGLCNQKLGKLATAWTMFNESADMAEREGQHKRSQSIRARAEALEPRLTRLLFKIAGAPPPGLKITRDGQDVTLLLNEPSPVDPGTYELEVTADGFLPHREQVEVAGEGKTITVELPELEPAPREPDPASAKSPKPEPQPNLQVEATAGAPPDTHRRRRIIAYGVGIGGLALTGTGIVFGALARSKWNDSRDHCDSDNRCSTEGLDLIDSAQARANLSNVFVGVGLAAVAGAGVLWFFSRPEDTRPDAGAHLVPALGREHLGLALEGRF